MLTCWKQLLTHFHPANKCLESGLGQSVLSTDESGALLTKAPKLQANGPSSAVFQYVLPVKMQAASISCWKLCSCIYYESCDHIHVPQTLAC